MRLKEKRGLLYWTVLGIILNIAFFAVMFIFIGIFSTGATIKEQVYAKQIALLIDQAKPGTTLTIGISELYEAAEKEKFTGEIVNIDKETREVIVRLVRGKGYSFRHFNGAAIRWEEDKENKKLKIYVS